MATRFWALELEPGQTYTQNPPYPLHLTQIALDAKAKGSERNVVECMVDGGKFTLGSLRLGSVEQFSVDLLFDGEKEVSFSVQGKSAVHLSGYYIFSEDDLEYLSDEEEGEEEEGEETLAEEEADEFIETVLKPRAIRFEDEEAAKQAKTEQNAKAKTNGSTKAQEVKSENKQSSAKPAENKVSPKQAPAKRKQDTELQVDAAVDSPAPVPKKQKQAQRVEVKTPSKDQTSPSQTLPNSDKKKGAQTSPATGERESTPLKHPKVSKHPNGLVVEEIVLGNGEPARVGHKVGVKYVGKLANGKTFDSSLIRPFTFRLGQGNVIAGWDAGIKGMKVGGKRKLIIPPSLGYGGKGAPPTIPPNATLHFDVELVEA